MAQCCSTGCHRTDELGNDTEMYFELIDDTWVTVCWKHVDHTRPTIELTDGVKDVDVGTLTHIKNELADD